MNDIIEFVPETTFQEDIATIKDVTTKVFLISGKILQNIQDSKKYKEAGYSTFEKAVKAELGLDRAYAYELIKAAQTFEILSGIPDIMLPTSASQLRCINNLDSSTQVEVWKEVAKDKVPTAKEVQTVVNRLSGKVVKSGTMSRNKESFNETFLDEIDSLKNQLDKALAENTLLNNAIVECVDNERKLLEKIELLTLHISKLEGKETPAPQPQKNNVLLREDAFNFIMKHGSNLQKMAITNTNPDNEKMFTYFCGTRRDYLVQYPPSSLPENIRNAESIIN